jgi:hypothetical protein
VSRLGRRIGAIAAAAPLATTVLACDSTSTCAARGQDTTLSGLVTYAIGGGAGTTLSQQVTVDDYSAACAYDDEQFLVVVGACQLWASLAQGPTPPTNYRFGQTAPGNPDAFATIDPGQTCAIPIVDGTAILSSVTGTIAFGDSTTELALAGTVDAGDAGTTSLLLQWQFASLQSPP